MRANVKLISSEAIPCDPHTVQEWWREYETTFFMGAIGSAQSALYALQNPGEEGRYGSATRSVILLARETHAYAMMLEFAEFLGIDRFIDPGRLATAQRRVDRLVEMVEGLSEQLVERTFRLSDIDREVQALLPRIG